MKKHFEYTASLSLYLLILMDCNNTGKSLPDDNYSRTKGFDWLVGTWENQSKEGTLTEVWTKMNDSTFSGQSYFVAGNDTSFSESISLVQKKWRVALHTCCERAKQWLRH
jgi:hypothetical protein